jgi:hypothetical protein
MDRFTRLICKLCMEIIDDNLLEEWVRTTNFTFLLKFF